MSEVTISWKKITRGLPKSRKYADDSAPTIAITFKKRILAIHKIHINEKTIKARREKAELI